MKEYRDDSFPKALTKEETIKYFQLAKNGDIEAKNKLKRHNLRLITYRIIQRFSSTNIEFDELVNIGAIGLMKAVETFDVDKKISFANYAIVCIDNEILIYIRNQKKHRDNVSINNLVISSNSDEDGGTFEDFFADEEDFVEDVILLKESCSEIREALSVLNPLELRIVKMYYGFGCHPIGQCEIAKIVEFDQSSVSKILSVSRKKLKKVLDLNETKVLKKSLYRTLK